jgi:hypothetical protein
MLHDRGGADDAPGEGKAVADGWVFAGSFIRPDPDSGARIYAGNISGILVGIWPDPSTVIQYGIASGNPYEGLHNGLEIDEKRVPKLGTKVNLIFSRHFSKKAEQAAENNSPGRRALNDAPTPDTTGKPTPAMGKH